MAKIKLNLPTGSVEEKSLLTCFKNLDKEYIVFDADSVGSMGLPIILVCKFQDNRVIKITDANEWNEVKGYLKEIISGTPKDLATLPDTVDADEVYYTQLTLPVASFEAIKKSYNPEAIAPNVEPVADETIAPAEAPVDNSLESSIPETNTTPEISPVVGENPASPEIFTNVADTMEAPAEQPNDETIAEANPLLSESPIINNEVKENNVPMADEPVMDMNNNTDIIPNIEQPIVSEDVTNPVAPESITPSETVESPILDITTADVVPDVSQDLGAEPTSDAPAAPVLDLGDTPADTNSQDVGQPASEDSLNIAPSLASTIENSDALAPTLETPVEEVSQAPDALGESLEINPVSEPVPEINNDLISTSDNAEPPVIEQEISDTVAQTNKEAFLKACSDAFDALIKEIKG